MPQRVKGTSKQPKLLSNGNGLGDVNLNIGGRKSVHAGIFDDGKISRWRKSDAVSRMSRRAADQIERVTFKRVVPLKDETAPRLDMLETDECTSILVKNFKSNGTSRCRKSHIRRPKPGLADPFAGGGISVRVHDRNVRLASKWKKLNENTEVLHRAEDLRVGKVSEIAASSTKEVIFDQVKPNRGVRSLGWAIDLKGNNELQ
jgi:hypothetical protein